MQGSSTRFGRTLNQTTERRPVAAGRCGSYDNSLLADRVSVRIAFLRNVEPEETMLPHCRNIVWIGVLVLAGFAPGPGLTTALDGIKPGQILEHIKVLASDEFEGRGPGTPGEEKTVAYLSSQFQKMGLKPGNPDGTYVQAVPLVGFQAKQVTGAFEAGTKTVALSFPNDFVAVSRRHGRGSEGPSLGRRLRGLRRGGAGIWLG